MKKNNILLLILFVSSIFATYAQENKTIRPIDDKYSTIDLQIEQILKQNNTSYNAEEFSNNFPKSNVSQFTDNEVLDIELHAAINPTDTNNIVIGWMKMDPASSSLPLVFSTYYTTDFGETWNEGIIDFMPRNTQANEAMSGGGDPMIVFDTDGNLYISWLYTIVRVISEEEIYVDAYLTYAKSTDKGATWIRPDNGDDFISSGTLDYVWGSGITGVNTGNFPDKEWFAINPTNNDLFVSLAEFNTTDNYNTGIDTWGVRRKQADATLFEEKVVVPPAGTVWGQLGSIAIDKNGDIHTVYPYYPEFPDPPLEKLMHSVSTDNGETYSETPHFISDVDVTNFQGVGQENNTSTGMYDRLYPCSYIAIDTCSQSDYEGRLYTVWNSNDPDYNKKVDIWLSYSDDSGDNWSEPAIVNTDPPRDYGFHHHPTIYVNPDGILVLAWYDNRGYEIPNVYMNDYYYALSYDGGETFEEYKLTPEPFNYNDDNFESSVGIGEYFQILATENNVIAFYTTFDGEDTEIYYNILPFGEATNINESQPLTTQMSVKNIYPNPVTDILSIDIVTKQNTSFNYQIYNTEGKLVKQGIETKYSIGNNNKEISVNDLEIGIYYISFNTEWGVFVKKFIKK